MTANLDFVTQLPRELTRTEQVQRSRPAAPEQRRNTLAAAAQALSRRGIAAAKVELVNAALLELAQFVYMADTDGAPVHFDPVTLRIGPALPWGSNGHRAWGLRASEARALRKIMLDRAAVANPQPWLVYDEASKGWIINGYKYPSLDLALGYLSAYAVTLQEWRAAVAATRSQWAKKHLGE